MGDRAVIAVRSDAKTNPVYLYSHWEGDKIPSLLHSVISRKTRWDDDSYLSRMIFSAMVRDNIDGDTGYGISTIPVVGLQHPIILVDTTTLKIHLIYESTEVLNNEFTYGVSYQDFVACQEEVNWNTLKKLCKKIE